MDEAEFYDLTKKLHLYYLVLKVLLSKHYWGQEREIQVNLMLIKCKATTFYSCRSTNYFNIKLRFLLEIFKLDEKNINSFKYKVLTN
jgi:hypothetical protein